VYLLSTCPWENASARGSGNVGGDDEFSDGRESPILRAIEIGDGRAHTTERGIPLSVLRRASGQQT
jgi:hypothetical protein